MQFLGMFRHVRTTHAQGLTKEMFVSLGQNAVSARDVYAQGGLIVLCEGEIRNKDELVKKLKLNADASLSMICARAYRMWGADYPRRIEGAAVTCVIDRTEDRMILSSDRAGAIGVYYAWRGRSVAFASHPALLLKMGAAGRKVEREGLIEMFAFGGFYSPGRTPFKDIRALECGCVLIADSRGMRIKRYDSVVQRVLSGDAEPFLLEDYLKGIKKRNLALFLSDGYSKKSASLLKDESGTVLFRCSEKDEKRYENCALYLGKPLETVFISEDDFINLLEEAVEKTGFPGAGFMDVVFLNLFREAFSACGHALLGGQNAVVWKEAEKSSLLRFLKKEIRDFLDADGYVRDRINELTDRLHIPFDDEKDEARAKGLLCALSTAPAYLARMRLLAGARGGECLSPLMDERFLASELIRDEKNAHPAGSYIPDECAKKILMETEEILENDAQPLLELIDTKAVRAEIRSDGKDVNELSRLIQINAFFCLFDAEVSGI